MQRLEVSGAVRPIYGSLGVKRLKSQIQQISALLNFFFFPAKAETALRTVSFVPLMDIIVVVLWPLRHYCRWLIFMPMTSVVNHKPYIIYINRSRGVQPFVAKDHNHYCGLFCGRHV